MKHLKTIMDQALMSDLPSGLNVKWFNIFKKWNCHV